MWANGKAEKTLQGRQSVWSFHYLQWRDIHLAKYYWLYMVFPLLKNKIPQAVREKVSLEELAGLQVKLSDGKGKSNDSQV